jgi:hypothetical protein
MIYCSVYITAELVLARRETSNSMEVRNYLGQIRESSSSSRGSTGRSVQQDFMVKSMMASCIWHHAV